MKNVFENNEGKGENAGNHHFFPFSDSLFYPITDRIKHQAQIILSLVQTVDLDM